MVEVNEGRNFDHYVILDKKRWKVLTTVLAIVATILIVLVIAIPIIHFYFPKMENGVITRNISDIVQYLPEQPEDMIENPYEAGLPLFVRFDIMRMQERYNCGKSASIVYQSDNTLNYLEIKMYNNKITFSVNSKSNAYLGEGYSSVEANVSLYRTDYGLIIYGRNSTSTRNFVHCTVSQEWVQSGPLTSQSIDLVGVGHNEDFDDVWQNNSNATMVRQGNSFTFFCNGIQYGSTVEFPGGEIQNSAKYYILDSNDDLYYMYYSTNEKNPKVEFVKVAEGIDGIDNWITVRDTRETDIEYKFPIYKKDNRYYVALPNNMWQARWYGQTNGKCHEAPFVKFWDDVYEFKTVEISEENVKLKRLTLRNYSSHWQVEQIYCYLDMNYEVYTTANIKGLDSDITSNIPTEEIALFEGRTVTPEEYGELIDELKKLYERYE